MVLHLLTSLFCAAVAQEPPVDDAAFYARSVQPILAEHCFECHGDEGRPKAGLRLTSRSAFLAGGDSGPVQVGDGPFDASALLEAIGYEDEFLQMPPNGKLSADSLAILRDWIARGAPYDAQSAGDGAAPGDAPAEQHRITRGDGLTGWAYRPVAAPDLSQALGSSTDAHPIDALVRAKLVERGLAPNPRADEATLVRRVYLDLTGLAPSPEEVAAYLGNDDPQKWAELIERLLASPQYGERWGRHWLDVVRYAETNGFERDSNKPHIWRYRDWVVDAFNADMPYDEFVRDQLAGDELPDRDRSSIIGSGYLRLSQWDDEPGAGPLQGRYDVLDDIVSTTSQAFLGSTIG
ncbi:MAG: DUF1549 domain-containing protein, partial [Planctomycetota bacterium]